MKGLGQSVSIGGESKELIHSLVYLYWRQTDLGDGGDPPLEQPAQRHVGRRPLVLLGDGLEHGVHQDVRHLLAPGQVGRPERGEPDQGDPVLVTEAPRAEIRQRLQGGPSGRRLHFVDKEFRVAL